MPVTELSFKELLEVQDRPSVDAWFDRREQLKFEVIDAILSGRSPTAAQRVLADHFEFPFSVDTLRRYVDRKRRAA
jgi:UTP-glucose-1-phosphate uridylyltransferase